MTRIEDFRVLPGAVEGMARLAGCGFLLVIVSNQRGVARGLVSKDLLRETESVLRRSLEPEGVGIAGFYYCPHEIADDCECRKPRPGLLLDAAAELDLDLEASWMIGDSPSDVAAGSSAGCRTAHLGNDPVAEATISAESLQAAASRICAGD